MPVFEVYGRITRRGLKNRTKTTIADRIREITNLLNLMSLSKDDLIDIYLFVLRKLDEADKKAAKHV